MPSTSFPDSHRDLLDAPIGVLTTVGPSGVPEATAVWFLFEDGEVRISLNDTRRKARNLVARPVCSLFVVDDTGYRYLDVRGRARIEPDPDYAFADREVAKYGGALDMRALDRQGGGGRVVVAIEPTNVYALDMRAAAG